MGLQAGTPVTVAPGATVPIEQIRVGDKVLGHDGQPVRIKRTFRYPVGKTATLRWSGGIDLVGCRRTRVLTTRGWLLVTSVKAGEQLVLAEAGSPRLWSDEATWLGRVAKGDSRILNQFPWPSPATLRGARSVVAMSAEIDTTTTKVATYKLETECSGGILIAGLILGIDGVDG